MAKILIYLPGVPDQIVKLEQGADPLANNLGLDKGQLKNSKFKSCTTKWLQKV